MEDPVEGEGAGGIPPGALPPRITYTLRAGGDLTFNTGYDDASGDVSIARGTALVGVSRLIDTSGLVNLTFQTEQSRYDFDNTTALIPGTADPMDVGATYEATLSYAKQENMRWSWNIGGTVGVSGERGADVSDSFIWSVFGGVRQNFSENFNASLGLFVSSRIEDNPLVLPGILFEWKIDERWSLYNDRGAGGTLEYAYDDTLSFTFDGGWESRDYRLDDDSPLPSGVFRDSRVPLALGTLWKPDQQLEIRARAGAHFFQEFETLNSSGKKVADIESDPSLFITLSVEYRF